MNTENRSVREVEMLRPRLREGLRFSVQEIGGRRVCVIEDSLASRFHRVGLGEYRFFRALDGTRSVASILAQLARDGGGESFTEHEALQMIRWLKDNHLLAVESARAANDREHTEQAMNLAATWLNPLVVKIPLARPDGFFTRVEPWLGWALGGFGFAVWLVVVLTGAAETGMEWPRFVSGFDGILARDNWLWLFLVWLVFKSAHEFSHGLFCKHFGATVREIGAIFVLFVPMGYVDATASLGLASKWRRIMVSSAGLYMEFFLAALAAIVWAHTGPGLANTIAHNAVVTGTVVTLFFNANPLMRFDGYYILGDLLELPNLGTRGRAWVQTALAWLLAGGRELRPSPLRTREEWIVAFYGVAATVWQVVVLAGLLAGASVALHGGGVLLAVIAAVAWVALPVWRFAAPLAGGGPGRRMRMALRGALFLAAVALALFAPFHRSVSSPGVVELADTQTLRAECPGFVERVNVYDGELVHKNQILLELSNDEAAALLAKTRVEFAQQELRARVAYTDGDVSAFQAENAKAQALREAVANHESYLATLLIRAPMDGRVTNRKLAQMPGSFVESGGEILRIGRPEASDVKIAAAQEDEPHLHAALNQPMRVRIEGRGYVFDATLLRVEAKATRDLINPALTAMSGGPLAVRRAEETAAHEEGADAHSPQYELAEPHFSATARLATHEPLGIGEMARVKFRSPRTVTLWGEFQGAIARWMKRYTAREARG